MEGEIIHSNKLLSGTKDLHSKNNKLKQNNIENHSKQLDLKTQLTELRTLYWQYSFFCDKYLRKHPRFTEESLASSP
jgi:peptidoglycan hydrolase CwlO-like protein